MRTLQADLDAAIAFHGHLCSGMVLGVRMARLAMRYLGIEEPLVYKDLIVYVEMDRCVADAVCVVTGCSLGKRRLKWMDYGKVAATFVDLAVDRSVRVAVVANRFPAAGEDLIIFWQAISDEEIFKLEQVQVSIPPEDLPGKPQRMTNCIACGEQVLDGREVMVDERVLCRSCARGAYYKKA